MFINMNSFVLFILAVIPCKAAGGIEEEDNVLVLNKINFPEAFKDNEHILVELCNGSWGYGCAEAGIYGVYADVIELKDWINGVINA